MANNSYVNKVEFGSTTVMDITDTTAETEDVLDGKVFYAKSGARSVGTLGDATQSTHGLMSTSDKIKLDGITLLGVNLNSNALTPDANGYVNIPVMTGATSNANGSVGLVPAPTSADVDKFLAGDGTYKSGGLPMVILSYGNSTWAEFEAAYNNNVIVYARASSNSNPASGSQTRMAFMAYVNNATTPTEVEFQYYRSMSSHSATAMGDQVFVYKLTKTSGWSVTTRDASIKQIKAGTGTALGVSWSSNVVTLTNTMTAANMPMSSSDSTTVSSAIETNSEAITNLNSKITDIRETSVLTNIILRRVGNVVSMFISDGMYNTNSSANIIDGSSNEVKVPSGYKPIWTTTFLEAYAAKRLTVQTNGTIQINGQASQTGIVLRASATWITSDAMPS